MAMSSLEVGEVLLVSSDGFLELLDILGPALSEGRLGLAVSLLPLLGSCVDLTAAISTYTHVAVEPVTLGG